VMARGRGRVDGLCMRRRRFDLGGGEGVKGLWFRF